MKCSGNVIGEDVPSSYICAAYNSSNLPLKKSLAGLFMLDQEAAGDWYS